MGDRKSIWFYGRHILWIRTQAADINFYLSSYGVVEKKCKSKMKKFSGQLRNIAKKKRNFSL